MYIGLDYHRHFIQLCVLDRAGTVLCNRRCDSLLCDLLEVAGGFGTRIRAVIEAEIEVGCGAVDLADALTTAGWSVSLAHAGYVSRIRQSPDKTDFSDARPLADLTRVGYLLRVWLAFTVVRELRALMRQRQSRANERRRIKQQIFIEPWHTERVRARFFSHAVKPLSSTSSSHHRHRSPAP